MSKKMFSWNGSFRVLPLGLLGLMLVGGCCCCKDVRCYTDSARPEWSYDKPYYYRPADVPPPVKDFDQEAPEIYTSKRLLEIPRPEVGDTRKAPRMAVWMTKDYGMHWDRIGYFGLQQRYFPFEVDEDGYYGIRFIGPGIPPTQCKPPRPHIVYHVDTVVPCVAVFISPSQEYYYAGQRVSINWVASDPNLADDSVSVGICFGGILEKPRWQVLGEGFPCEGSLEFEIPDEALDKSMTIRVTARDKAGNLGQGYSCPIMVCYEPVALDACDQPVEMGETINGQEILTTMPTSYPTLDE